MLVICKERQETSLKMHHDFNYVKNIKSEENMIEWMDTRGQFLSLCIHRGVYSCFKLFNGKGNTKLD